jgi:hypothetical protein
MKENRVQVTYACGSFSPLDRKENMSFLQERSGLHVREWVAVSETIAVCWWQQTVHSTPREQVLINGWVTYFTYCRASFGLPFSFLSSCRVLLLHFIWTSFVVCDLNMQL